MSNKPSTINLTYRLPPSPGQRVQLDRLYDLRRIKQLQPQELEELEALQQQVPQLIGNIITMSLNVIESEALMYAPPLNFYHTLGSDLSCVIIIVFKG